MYVLHITARIEVNDDKANDSTRQVVSDALSNLADGQKLLERIEFRHSLQGGANA